jgi:hydroxyacylglutathione hydrolase
MLKIDALPAFTDNYIWLLQDTEQRSCAVVDPGDAAPVLAWLAANPTWQLRDILITHHHPDHVGGVAALKAATGARVSGPARETIPQRDLALSDGDAVEVLGLTLQVLDVPGHTLGHIAYYQPEHHWLFCGDTLFAAGCGRLFEGTPEQMHHSLSRLAALPGQTAVYCTHEYTLSNLRFACAVEPQNATLIQRQPVQELHCEVGPALLRAVLQRSNNVRVRELRHDSRLILEHRPMLGIQKVLFEPL